MMMASAASGQVRPISLRSPAYLQLRRVLTSRHRPVILSGRAIGLFDGARAELPEPSLKLPWQKNYHAK